MIKNIIVSLLGALFLAGLVGCNTMEGAGKDISAGGQAIKNSAQEHKAY